MITSVVLVAVGLLVADAATYGFLRASLIHRVDRQLDGVRPVAARALLTETGGQPSLRADAATRLRRRQNGIQRLRRNAPAATYGQIRDATGVVLAERSFGLGEVEGPPDLPADLPGSGNARNDQARTIFTAPATGGADLRYRVLAAPLPKGGGTLVLAIPLLDLDSTLRRLIFAEAVVSFAVLIAVGLLATWSVKLGLRPLEEMGATADAIAGGDLSRRVYPAERRSEVGRLGLALNAMLDRIEAAFVERGETEERLRRFVADASHELRTPLTSIRGYAELFRRGASRRPEDLRKAMRRIEDESARMGLLVDELLLLVRLDQGRALEVAPFDFSQLAQEVASDARAADPRYPIEVDAPGGVTVEGDQAKLHQVIANLVNNAFAHTPSGTPIHIRVRQDRVTTQLEVADRGPGMDAQQAARVFDRFFRVDPSRSRDKGGAGLGLSIAAAIVEAHGGKISVETSPGKGALFRIAIPRKE